MKKKIILIISGLFFIFFLLLVSANLEINSPNYSGFFTQGASSGNITDSNYSGDSASFYQQASGYLNDLLFSGIHGFSFAAAEFTGFVPALSIVNPQNKTYITTMNLPLSFTVNNQIYTFYNLDNGANTTITQNTTFNTINGLHTLYLFANNTYGNSSTNVAFNVNASKFVIHYANYSGQTRGSSTDFNQSTYEDLQNLSGVILENTNFGKIKFNQAINLTNDSDPNDGILDLDSNTNISSNYININSAALPNFDISATLSLYNLTFISPIILKDGSVCPSTICTEINYSGGTLVFNVTQFSAYSVEETPTETPAGGQQPSSGGSSGTAAEFNLDKNEISVSLNPGQVKTENITITNTGEDVISVTIDNTIPDFVVRSEAAIVLKPGESKVVSLYILARVNTIPDLYLGKIILSSGTTRKEILIAIEVQSTGALLDVGAEIPTSYKKILPGKSLIAGITLFNLGSDQGRKDILLEYLIKDFDNNSIFESSESVAIETQTSFIRTFEIPPDAKIGQYILYVKTVYSGKTSSASDNFEIVSSIVTSNEKLYIVIIIILSVILSLVAYVIILRKIKGKKTGGKVDLRKIMKGK